ncbi:protein of unknown function [Pustulibacterium marinum]|uniref:DUF748 domain-containing protein n=1 Tax=Pustulibacterium marinum TaxID=1224947 RepID=A0A1I7ETD3_9FLAO|nr:DUF748 domain-containing protein [Pustulibacterium marinum]SFU27214.1 protein of unknown function [Pustulibacterium marinum]
MSKVFKGFLIFLLLVVAILLAAGFFASGTVEKKVTEALSKNFLVSIGDTKINFWNTTATFSNVSLQSKNREKDSLSINAKDVHVNFQSLLNVIKADTIKISKIDVAFPTLAIYKAEKDSTKSKKIKEKDSLPKSFLLKNLEVNNGNVSVYSSTDTLQTSSKNFQILLADIAVNNKTVTQNIPFEYSLKQIRFSEFYQNAGKRKELTAKNLVISDSIIEVSGLHLKPRFSKKEYINHIDYQDDWMDLTVSNIKIHHYDVNFFEERKSIKIPKIEIDSTYLNLYRDKSVKRDFSYKPMYSKMLRDLDFDLVVDSLEITNTKLDYEERLPGRVPGIIDFADMHILITDINNVDTSKKTNITIDCQFLKEAPLHVDWMFDIHSKKDYFEIKGNLGSVDVKQLNNFMDPMMNIQVSGRVDAVMFNFYGTDASAKGEFTMKYHDLKVELLKKGDRKKKRKFLSAIANIFVHKVREDLDAKQIEVERTKYKSFFNYFWLCVQDGIKKTVVF